MHLRQPAQRLLQEHSRRIHYSRTGNHRQDLPLTCSTAPVEERALILIFSFLRSTHSTLSVISLLLGLPTANASPEPHNHTMSDLGSVTNTVLPTSPSLPRTHKQIEAWAQHTGVDTSLPGTPGGALSTPQT